jgi:CubicO group peptidase (beta-lactamase class C family)
MSPEIANRLARVFPALMQKSAVAAVAPVADVARYARKPPELQPLQPLHVECGEAGKTTREAVAAHVASPLAPDRDAIEERAGQAADRVPACYLGTWARLNCQKPTSVSEAAWRLVLDDGGRFLDSWGADAATMLWTAGELFDVPHDGRAGGLVWQLKGERVGALGEERARLTGGRTIGRGARE